MQNLSALEKLKILRISGNKSIESIQNSVDSALKDNENLYILDFSKAICPEWNEGGFYFEHKDKRIQGVILPSSIENISYCDCPDLKFVQFSDSVSGFSKAPFCSTTLRFIFITGDKESYIKDEKNTPVKFYNSAKIIFDDCFEYASKNKISLFRLNAANKEKDYDFYIPPEEVKVSTKVSYDCNFYSMFTTTETSDRRDFSVSWIELKDENTGLSEEMFNDYKVVFDKMNEFISWNRNRFYNTVVKEWKPGEFCRVFYVSQPKITRFESYISISCYFTYDSGYFHVTHEYKAFCYDTKTKQFVNLSKASGWTNEELHELIINADINDDAFGNFKLSEYDLDISLETIENLDFEFLENGKIRILFSDYILNRYSYEYDIERKNYGK